MSEQTHPTEPWTEHLTPWVSSLDAPAPRPLGPVFEHNQLALAHPFSTNTDHTGLRSSLEQFRLPRTRVHSAA